MQIPIFMQDCNFLQACRTLTERNSTPRGLSAQVTDALNSGALTPPDIPYDLMRTLLHSPAIMAELRSFVASGSGVRPAAPCVLQFPCI